MRSRSAIAALAAAMAFAFNPAVVLADDPAPNGSQGAHHIDVNQLFAATCGWCHSDAGRSAGKGPQLMDSKRSDDYIRNRIKNGKEGGMPAFGSTLNDAEIDQVIAYIRALKPE